MKFSNINLLDELARPELAPLLSAFHERRYARQAIIFAPQYDDDLAEQEPDKKQEGNFVFIVKSGLVRIYLSYGDREFTIAFLKPGDLYVSHSNAFVQVLEDAVLLLLDTPTFNRCMMTIPEFTVPIVRVLGGMLKSCFSIIDGLALGVETPAGRVVHTGDFKIDPKPLDGPGTDLGLFKSFAGKRGAMLLLSDSTNVEREGRSLSEREVLANLRSLFAKATGRIIVTLFSSHIQRIQEVFDCAAEFDRTVVVGGRSLVNNIEMARNLSRLRPPANLVLDARTAPSLADNKSVLLVTGSQGEPLSALSRIVSGGHRSLSIHEGDMVIMSSRLIPGNTMAVNTLVNNLYRLGAEVYYDKEHPVHASGHAQQSELTEMIKAVHPEYFVPLHGEYRHLVKHARLAVQCGVDEANSLIFQDGQPFTITPAGLTQEEPIPAQSILVDGKGVGDVGQAVLKERHILGGEGMVVVVLVLDRSTWHILQGPELFSKGFVFEQEYSHVLEDAKCLVLDCVEGYPPGEMDKLQERIRASLRRFFRNILDRDPIIVPAITAV